MVDKFLMDWEDKERVGYIFSRLIVKTIMLRIKLRWHTIIPSLDLRTVYTVVSEEKNLPVLPSNWQFCIVPTTVIQKYPISYDKLMSFPRLWNSNMARDKYKYELIWTN